MAIKIISDSGCDLPKDLIEKYDIDILPLFVIKDEKEYLDKIDIKPEKVLTDMKDGMIYKTSQVMPNKFVNKFKEYVEKGDSIIYISLSSELSGTYGSSVIAKEEVLSQYRDADINLIDSRSASGGFGLIVLEAAKMVRESFSKEEIIDRIKALIENVEHIFTIGDIEYLYRGGRVSKAQNIIGGLLSIKPILWVNDGRLEPLEKVRGKNKVYKSMIDVVRRLKEDTDLSQQTIIISHGNDEKSAIKLRDMIQEEFGVQDFLINTIGAVIGAHAGPGTVAVFFLRKNV